MAADAAIKMTPMKSQTTAIIACLALAASPALARTAGVHKPGAQTAQTAAPIATRRGARKRPATKPAAKKAPAAIAKAYSAMPLAERLAIQSDLAWIGDYEGAPGGDFGDERVIDAVKLFQKGGGGKDTGMLSDEERARLAAAAEPPRAAVGWRLIDDPATGARFGLPEKLVSLLGASRIGSRWISGHGQIQIEDFALSEASLPALFEEEKKTPRGRYVESSALTPDSFVISGTQGLKNFVVRAEAEGGEVRGITVLYDQANAGIMAPVAIAMANSFEGFPDPTAAPLPGQERTVEYATAIAIDRSGDLITTRQVTADCEAITVPGFGHAERIAEDKSANLALIRLYGARDLQPAPLAGVGQGDSLTLIGIADPQTQQGGDAVTRETARLDGQGIAPAPRPGFSGAAAVDARGGFAGIVAMKSSAVAGLAPASEQASLVPAAIVRAFLAAHRIAPAPSTGAFDQSVLRVICVRK